MLCAIQQTNVSATVIIILSKAQLLSSLPLQPYHQDDDISRKRATMCVTLQSSACVLFSFF